MSIHFKKNRGWVQLDKALEPGPFKKAVLTHLHRASILNGKIAEAEIRNTIKRGHFIRNAPLTRAIKGGGKPLVGYRPGAQLFGSITSKSSKSAMEVFVGVLKANEFYNVAYTLHQGVVIKVTEKMRGMFFVLWLASIGKKEPSELTGATRELWDQKPGGWMPLKKSTASIFIPPRPFITAALRRKSFQKTAKANWEKALAAAYKEVAR